MSPHCFKLLGNTHPTRQRDTLEDLNLQSCGNLKPCKIINATESLYIMKSYNNLLPVSFLINCRVLHAFSMKQRPKMSCSLIFSITVVVIITIIMVMIHGLIQNFPDWCCHLHSSCVSAKHR